VKMLTEVYTLADLASHEGPLHRIDPRIKVSLWFFLVIIIATKNTLFAELVTAVVLLSLVFFARVGVLNIYPKTIAVAGIFGFLISLPSAVNVVVPGTLVIPLLHLDQSYHFWVYAIPQKIGLTAEGIRLVALITLRIMNSLTVSMLLLATTPFNDVIKALKVFRIPDTILVIISLTYKYIMIFAGTVSDMYLAKQARLAGSVSNATARSWIVSRIGFLFRKTQWKCDEIYKAMNSRGFSGSIQLIQNRRLCTADFTVLAVGLIAGMGMLFL